MYYEGKTLSIDGQEYMPSLGKEYYYLIVFFSSNGITLYLTSPCTWFIYLQLKFSVLRDYGSLTWLSFPFF